MSSQLITLKKCTCGASISAKRVKPKKLSSHFLGNLISSIESLKLLVGSITPSY